MAETCDILVIGTGAFGSRIIFDIATTTEAPVIVAIGGRDRERMDWLRLAANARAALQGRPARFFTVPIDFGTPESIAEAIGPTKARVIVQASSVQSSRVIHDPGSAWAQLVARAGLSTTAVFQALLSSRVGKALADVGNDGAFINCCYPDVANSLLEAMGIPVTCGSGNVSILASAFAGDLGIREQGRVRVLAHYACLAPWRGPAEERPGQPGPRVWIDGEEITDTYERFSHLQLTREPVIEISGFSGVPIILALAAGTELLSHAPGPRGLLGGYPIAVRGGAMELDLPEGLGRDEAIAWNRAFEERGGMLVDDSGQVAFTGMVKEEFARYSPDLAAGFNVADLEAVHDEMARLREKMLATA